MRIVIAGAGEVGTHLAKMLSVEEQDIIVMDVDNKKLEPLENYNLLTHQGSAISFSDLNAIKTGACDLFIAVTKSEARNILACSMAKRLGAKKTVARLDNDEFFSPKWREHIAHLGIDHLIYPEMLAAKEIASALKRTWARNWFELFDGELIVVGVKIRNNARIVNQMLKDVSNISHFLHVSAIKRNREIIIPRGDDRILENDIIYVATTLDHIDEVREVCGKTQSPVDNVLIVGGNDIAEQLIKRLGKTVDIKIIEADRDRCLELSERLDDKVIIVNGDGRNSDMLLEEGIKDYDAFLALTKNDEANVLACVVAKKFGVSRTIADVENIEYISLAEEMGVDAVINRKLITAGRIFKFTLSGKARMVRYMSGTEAEVLEYTAAPGSAITKAPLREISFPKDAVIGGVIRGTEGLIAVGDTQIEAYDHVAVFALPSAVKEVDKLFR